MSDPDTPRPVEGCEEQSQTRTQAPLPPPIPIDDPIAALLLRFGLDHDAIPEVTFAKVLGGEWGGGSLQGADIDLRVEGESLVLTINNAHELERQDELVLNKPGTLRLDDGSTIEAKFTLFKGSSTTVGQQGFRSVATLKFDLWRWAPKESPVAWVGFLTNGYVERGNTVLAEDREGGRRTSNTGLRLRGCYTWTLLETADKSGTIVVIESGESLDRDKLWADFTALEFVLGQPLELNLLTGVDAQLRAVAAYAPHLGIQRLDLKPHAAPVPEGDTPEEPVRWIVPLFEHLTRHLGLNEPKVLVGVSGYVDALVDHIDANYLKAQIALEAIARKVLTGDRRGTLTKEPAAWQRWVEANEDAIKEHAFEKADEGTLVNKVIAAQQRPTTAAVPTALAALGIKVGKEELAEVRRRNVSAHDYVMTHAPGRDPEVDVRRVRMVRALLAAVVARSVEYTGPLYGWDLDKLGRRKVVRWWDDDEAQQVAGLRYYVATRSVT